MNVKVLPPQWKLQPFERELAAIEAEHLSSVGVKPSEGGLILSKPVSRRTIARLAKRLSFARAIESSSGEVSTLQYVLECAAGGGSRKVTSHGLHGLHPYKGKFYPQLARALLNVCDVPEGGIIVDPFAGCGTSVLEASLMGITAFGVDANPMGVLVSQAKLQLLGTPVEEVRSELDSLRCLPKSGITLPDRNIYRSGSLPLIWSFYATQLPESVILDQ